MMGYYMNQIYSDFQMKAEYKTKALEAIKKIVSSVPGFDKHFLWIDNNVIKKCETFEDAMDEWRWETIKDNENNIIGVSFSGEKLGDDLTLFETIAPFVKKGSFIQMIGEEDNIWRWTFNGEKCFEIYPTIIWEDV